MIRRMAPTDWKRIEVDLDRWGFARIPGVLAAEMKSDIHALAMRTLTPEEWANS